MIYSYEACNDQAKLMAKNIQKEILHKLFKLARTLCNVSFTEYKENTFETIFVLSNGKRIDGGHPQEAKNYGTSKFVFTFPFTLKIFTQKTILFSNIYL